MPICDPTIQIVCDGCGDEEETGLTPLARHGSYDERGIPGFLKSRHWTIDGDKTFCPDCAVNALDNMDD
jgi:hypothetical protein